MSDCETKLQELLNATKAIMPLFSSPYSGFTAWEDQIEDLKRAVENAEEERSDEWDDLSERQKRRRI